MNTSFVGLSQFKARRAETVAVAGLGAKAVKFEYLACLETIRISFPFSKLVWKNFVNDFNAQLKHYSCIHILKGERGANGKGGIGGKEAKNGQNFHMRIHYVSHFKHFHPTVIESQFFSLNSTASYQQYLGCTEWSIQLRDWTRCVARRYRNKASW